eukprot:759273-Hanusia_phi.AAC.3
MRMPLVVTELYAFPACQASRSQHCSPLTGNSSPHLSTFASIPSLACRTSSGCVCLLRSETTTTDAEASQRQQQQQVTRMLSQRTSMRSSILLHSPSTSLPCSVDLAGSQAGK